MVDRVSIAAMHLAVRRATRYSLNQPSSHRINPIAHHRSGRARISRGKGECQAGEAIIRRWYPNELMTHAWPRIGRHPLRAERQKLSYA